jgi:Fe-S-cluster formation regulator IscX/YfhJ
MKIINSWRQITLSQFTEILKLQSENQDAEQFTQRVIEYLYDVDPMAIPYTDYLSMIRGLNEFLDKPISEQKISHNGCYTINGTTYVLDIKPQSFTTAQYIDFTSFAKEPGKYVDLLSVVLIPEGHAYNDGYDMDKTKEDIGAMPVDNVLGIVSFFHQWSRASIKTILRFLTKQMRMRNQNRKTVRKLKREINRLSQCMESFHL